MRRILAARDLGVRRLDKHSTMCVCQDVRAHTPLQCISSSNVPTAVFASNKGRPLLLNKTKHAERTALRTRVQQCVYMANLTADRQT
jgi:hypothetical protein